MGGEGHAGAFEGFRRALGDIVVILEAALALGGEVESVWIDVLCVVDEDGGLRG